MGRKTWEVVRSMHGDGAPFGLPTYVASRTLRSAPPGVTLLGDDVPARVRALKSEPGKEIWLHGGGASIRPS